MRVTFPGTSMPLPPPVLSRGHLCVLYLPGALTAQVFDLLVFTVSVASFLRLRTFASFCSLQGHLYLLREEVGAFKYRLESLGSLEVEGSTSVSSLGICRSFTH